MNPIFNNWRAFLLESEEHLTEDDKYDDEVQRSYQTANAKARSEMGTSLEEKKKKKKKMKDDPCWKGYEMVGTKEKGGKEVPNCVPLEEQELEEAKPAKGKRFAKKVKGKGGRTRTVSYGQAGKAKDGGDRIRPGTAKGDAYCARSAKIKKCKNPPCPNDLSRKKWKCRGDKSVAESVEQIIDRILREEYENII